MYFDFSIGNTFCSNAAQCGAAHRGIFDDGDRCFRGPERHVGQRYRLGHQRRGRALRLVFMSLDLLDLGRLRLGVADQMQRRRAGEGGKPGQRQCGCEGAAVGDQRAAPEAALLRARRDAVR
jgi:hypothetical protein